MRTLLTSFADAFRSLRQNFLQTFLSMLGVIIGVAALVAMLSLIDGLEQLARDEISSKTNLERMAIRPNTGDRLDGIYVERDTVVTLNRQVMAELLADLPQAARAQLAVGGAAIGLAQDTMRLGIKYQAVTFPLLNEDLELLEGRWPAADTASRVLAQAEPGVLAQAEVVINKALSRKLSAPDTGLTAAIGQTFAFLEGNVTVVGVASTPEDTQLGDADLGLLLSYTQLPQLPGASEAGSQLQLEFASVEDVLPAKTFVKTWMAEHFEGVDDAVSIQTYEGYLEGIGQGFLVFRIVMGLLIGIAVVVGGVGIMNVMVMSVVERMAEIGIRKAIGANRRMIVAQFLSESVALSVIGSLLGTVLGIGVAMLGGPILRLFVKDMNFSAVFTLTTLLVVAIVAVLIGTVFGTYPALRASRMDPVVAIQRV